MPISPESLSQLVVAHAATLELYARQLCDAPEDAVQDAFVRLAAQASLPQRVLPWLFEVTRNRALSLRRAAQRRRHHEEIAARRDWFEPNDAAPLDADATIRAIEQLDADECEVLVAHIWGGLTFDEIGKLTATSSSTAHRRYREALGATENRIGNHMAEHDHLNDRDLASALAGLAPRQSRIDRERLLYLAGHAAAQSESRGRRFASLATLASGWLVAATLFGTTWRSADRPLATAPTDAKPAVSTAVAEVNHSSVADPDRVASDMSASSVAGIPTFAGDRLLMTADLQRVSRTGRLTADRAITVGNTERSATESTVFPAPSSSRNYIELRRTLSSGGDLL